MAAKLPCHVRIVEARDLKAADVHGTSDPLVVLSLKGLLKKKHRTAAITNTVNPIWNEEFVLECHHPEKDVLVIKVFDRDVGKNDLLGMVRIPVFAYFNRGPIDEWRPLLTRTGQPARGDIHIQITWGTGPIAHALADSQSMMSNRSAYGEPATVLQQQGGYPHNGLSANTGLQQGVAQNSAHHNPLDRNYDGRVDARDLAPGAGQQGLQQGGLQQGGLMGAGQQGGLQQGAHHNPLDRNYDGRVDMKDLAPGAGHQQQTGMLGQPGYQPASASGLQQTGYTQPITTVGSSGVKGTQNYQPGGAGVGQAQGYTTTTTTITHH